MKSLDYYVIDTQLENKYDLGVQACQKLIGIRIQLIKNLGI